MVNRKRANIPRSRVAIDQTCLVNLEPVKSGRVDNRAIARALGQIADNRTFVTLRPLGPKKLDLVASLHGDTSVGALSTLVASNVGSSVFRRRDEAEILIQRRPAGRFGMRYLGIDAPPGLSARVPFSICDDALNEAVGSHSGGESDEGQKAGEDCQSRIHGCFLSAKLILINGCLLTQEV